MPRRSAAYSRMSTRCATVSTSCGTPTSTSARSTASCSKPGHKETPGIVPGVVSVGLDQVALDVVAALLGLSELLDLLQLEGAEFARKLAAFDLLGLDLLSDGLYDLGIGERRNVAGAREVGDPSNDTRLACLTRDDDFRSTSACRPAIRVARPFPRSHRLRTYRRPRPPSGCRTGHQPAPGPRRLCCR